MSSSAADENNFEKARSHGRAAMWVNISGIICSVMSAIICVILFFTVPYVFLGGMAGALQNAANNVVINDLEDVANQAVTDNYGFY